SGGVSPNCEAEMTMPLARHVLDCPTDQGLERFSALASVAVNLQPDQKPEYWNDHVAVYEEVFEPLTNLFAGSALDHLDLQPGDRLIDVGAGAGGTALIAAARGVEVAAIDASPGMAARIATRASAAAATCGRV